MQSAAELEVDDMHSRMSCNLLHNSRLTAFIVIYHTGCDLLQNSRLTTFIVIYHTGAICCRIRGKNCLHSHISHGVQSAAEVDVEIPFIVINRMSCNLLRNLRLK